MNKKYLIGALVLIVLAVFIMNPDLLGSGGDAPSLSIVTTEDTQRIPTDVACTTVQDCIDYSIAQDPSATDVQAVCDETCTYITDNYVREVGQ